VVSAIVLVWWERRSVHPLVRRSITSNRRYLIALASNVLFQAGAFAVPFLLSFYFQLVLGLDARTAGITLLLPQVLMVGVGLGSGRFISRLGNRTLLIMGAAINAVGVLVLLTVRVDTPIYIPIFALAMVGIATGLYMPSLVGWALGKVQRSNVGLASALIETSRLLGMTFSNVIVIVTFSLILGTASIAQATDAGFVEAMRACSIGYLILTLICTLPPLLDPTPSSSR
jgi:predicted MFS family arabinose efflux permease